MYLIALLIALMTSLIPVARWSSRFGRRQWLFIVLVTLVQIIVVSIGLMLMPEPVYD